MDLELRVVDGTKTKKVIYKSLKDRFLKSVWGRAIFILLFTVVFVSGFIGLTLVAGWLSVALLIPFFIIAKWVGKAFERSVKNTMIYETKGMCTIDFERHTITFKEQEYHWNDLETIQLNYGGFRGQRLGRSTFLEGIEGNYLSWKMKEVEEKIQLLIDEEELPLIKDWLALMYDLKLPIKESMLGSKSYLLRSDLSYEEIQEIKKKLGVSSWY